MRKWGKQLDGQTYQFPLPFHCEVWHFLRLAQIKASPRCPRIEKSHQIMSRDLLDALPTLSHRFPSRAHFIWINLRPQVAHINPAAVALSRRASCKCAALLSLCPLQDSSGRRLWVHVIMRKFRVWISFSFSNSRSVCAAIWFHFRPFLHQMCGNYSPFNQRLQLTSVTGSQFRLKIRNQHRESI